MEEKISMQVYYPDTRIYRRIMYLALMKQNGQCQACRKPLFANEPIVRSDTRTARYYHFSCAERRRIAYEEETINQISGNIQGNNNTAF